MDTERASPQRPRDPKRKTRPESRTRKTTVHY
jgi:hypothetical protein